MSTRRGTCVAIATLLAGCTLFVDTSDLSQATGILDGGAPADAGPDASDAATAVPCSRHIAGADLPALLPLDPRWTYRGIAKTDELGAALTLGEQFTGGAMWWTEPTDLDRFDVTSVVRFKPLTNTTAADGLVFAWLRGGVPEGFGDLGGSFGVNGLPGYAVALDVLGHTVKVLDTSKKQDTWQLAIEAVGALVADDLDHVFRVRHEVGSVAVWFDGKTVLAPIPIPDYQTVRGAYGFSGATGGGVVVQHVTRVSFRADLCP